MNDINWKFVGKDLNGQMKWKYQQCSMLIFMYWIYLNLYIDKLIIWINLGWSVQILQIEITFLGNKGMIGQYQHLNSMVTERVSVHEN